MPKNVKSFQLSAQRYGFCIRTTSSHVNTTPSRSLVMHEPVKTGVFLQLALEPAQSTAQWHAKKCVCYCICVGSPSHRNAIVIVKALDVKSHFETARHGIYLLSELHLLFLMTPFCSTANNSYGFTCKAQWQLWHSYLSAMGDCHPSIVVADLVGVKLSLLRQVAVLF